mmetsp:Transcript_92509/g.299059  ORF Transcript_92509/g.299059 Transcript_92509/m.299059 type:complete len:207 (+) Transcript_92509:1260-1880(+)
MVLKLSSMSTKSAAFLDTAVPEMPMATPASARFSAGASFTPSPVIATMLPWPMRDSTNATLSEGCARAQTVTFDVITANSSVDLYTGSFESLSSSLRGVGGATNSGSDFCLLISSSPECSSCSIKRALRGDNFLTALLEIATCNRLTCMSLHHAEHACGSWPGAMMPTCCPMAMAVGRWSPVTMTTRMPARWHSSTLAGTVVRGGS